MFGAIKTAGKSQSAREEYEAGWQLVVVQNCGLHKQNPGTCNAAPASMPDAG